MLTARKSEPPAPHSSWPAVERDLRRVLRQSGKYAHEIDATIDAIRPLVVECERAGRCITDGVAWAVLACIADRQRRRAQFGAQRPD